MDETEQSMTFTLWSLHFTHPVNIEIVILGGYYHDYNQAFSWCRMLNLKWNKWQIKSSIFFFYTCLHVFHDVEEQSKLQTFSPMLNWLNQWSILCKSEWPMLNWLNQWSILCKSEWVKNSLYTSLLSFNCEVRKSSPLKGSTTSSHSRYKCWWRKFKNSDHITETCFPT